MQTASTLKHVCMHNTYIRFFDCTTTNASETDKRREQSNKSSSHVKGYNALVGLASELFFCTNYTQKSKPRAKSKIEHCESAFFFSRPTTTRTTSTSTSSLLAADIIPISRCYCCWKKRWAGFWIESVL